MASVLIVEDIAPVLFSLRIALESAGHRITTAPNGARGLALIESDAFDLVITDIWMPELDGAEVIRLGRKRSPRTRFLAVTGGDPNAKGQASAVREQTFGADRVLIKPFDMDDLLEAVTALLDMGPRLVASAG